MSKAADQPTSEVYPLIWSDDLGAVVDWAIAVLGLAESFWIRCGPASVQGDRDG